MKKTKFLRIVAETYKETKGLLPEPTAKQPKMMTERQIKNIYKQFRDVIKENIDESKFTGAIRGVFYEYAKGIVEATPTTVDPVRDPATAIKHADALQKKSDALKKAAKEIENIESATKTSITTAPESSEKETSVPIPSLTEEEKDNYIEEAILPAVVEIIKHSENPRATKKELLEMFKINKKK